MGANHVLDGARPTAGNANNMTWLVQPSLVNEPSLDTVIFVPMNKAPLVWGHKKIAMQNYGLTAGLCGENWVRRPMNIMLGWALVVLIIGCAVAYSVRAAPANDRPAEPRRRRPF